VTVYSKPGWMISGKLGLNLNDTTKAISQTVIWGGEVNKRLVGPVWAGVWGYNNLTFGLSVGLEF
jgi:hypothetical protein